MHAGPLRQDEKTSEYKGCENRRCKRPTQGKAAVVSWLVQEVADGRAQRPGEDECRPEQRYPGYVGPEISSRDNRQCGAKDWRSAFVSEAARIGYPVTKRCSQGLPVTVLPPASPSVVAAILMIQKARVTSGTLLNDSGISLPIPLHRELSFARFFCGA
jgi:hypothetical protein